MERTSNKNRRIIGIDYGMARIGLAYSDISHLIASPLGTLTTEKKSKATINKLVLLLQEHEKELDYSIEKIVVGLPLMMSGKAGLMADEVNHFITKLQEVLPDTPIVKWDERLSSVQAERSMREASMSRKKRAKKVDFVAAVIILQSYLDKLSLQSDNLPPLPPIT